MRPTMVNFTVCAILVLTISCGEHGTEPSKRGTINCVSWPKGAAIWLDGTDTGKVTDAELAGIDYGDHAVTFTIHGYFAHAETVSVNASTDPVTVYHSFSDHRPAVLRVLTQPPGALITLNDTALSITTPAVIPDVPLDYSDQCDVYLRLPGHYPYFVVAELAGEDTTTVSFTLEPCPDIDLTLVRGDTLYVIKADGIEQRVLATGLTNQRYYRVSPNGQYVAYLSLVGISNVISIVNWDGSHRTNLPTGSTDCAWSNSGDQLAYGRYVDGIYLYDAPSNTTRKIFQTQGFTYDHNPTFLPGDSLIAFVNHSYGTNARIRVMRADGSDAHSIGLTIITWEHDVSLHLCWVAPDAICWSDYSGINQVDPIAGTSEKVVTTTYLYDVAYSPDRTRYAFTEHGYQHGLYLGTVGLWDRRRMPDTSAGAARWLPGSACFQYEGDGHQRLAFWDGTAHFIAP